MSEAPTAPDQDRLPWLGEESVPAGDHRTRDAIGLAIVAALLIFGVSYWIASQNWQRERAQREAATAPPPAAVPLPKLPNRQHAANQPSRHRQEAAARVANRVAAERSPARPRQQVATNKVVTPTPVAKAPGAVAKPATAVARSTAPSAPKRVAIASATQAVTLPAREPPYGGIVRIGAFANPVQAQLGWRSMVRAYPALAHLPAVVVDASSARARPLYRFQIGTTSQANSAVLCQRMARINFTCGAVQR
jgi:hypothetical protein